MRVAQQAGSILGAVYHHESPLEAPWPIHEAVKHAASVIKWLELSKEDRPPQAIWLNNEMLDDHFEAVEARWNRESGSSPSQVPDFDEERGPVHQNPAAAAIKALAQKR